jgi:hypothetical protein
MLENHLSPFEDIAFPELQRQFGDLFSVRAQVEEYEYSMIISLLGNLHFARLEQGDHPHFSKTVRAAHFYLDQGALKRPRDVCEAYIRIVDEIPTALNRVLEKKNDAEEAEDTDKRIDKFLELYKTQYEGLMTLIAAPVVVGFALYYASKAKEFSPKQSGRVDLKAIESMEKWMFYPSNRLKEGLNRHIRNVYAHDRYRILDGKRMEIWDEDRRGQVTWGPEIWTLQQLEKLCHRLYLTCMGITLALMLFGINYRKLITDRGWIPVDKKTPPLRFEQSKRLFEWMAEYNSFTITKFDLDGSTLYINFKTHHRGIDQDVEIFVAGKGGSRGYKKPVKYVQVLLVQQVIGVLQRSAKNIDGVDRFWVTVNDEKDVEIGEFVISRVGLQSIKGPDEGKISVDRNQAEIDTLGDNQMWVKIEGTTTPL